MSCARYREAVSRRIDHEAALVPDWEVDGHLERCGPCRAWADHAWSVSRALRMHPAEQVPDLTARIMAMIVEENAGDRLGSAIVPAGAVVPGVVRLALLLVAFAQFLAASPALLGRDLGAPVHVAHEQGAWGLALAFAFAFAAWRPTSAPGLIPVLGVFGGAMAALGAIDVAVGRAVPSAELPHLMAVMGGALLWFEVHPPVALIRRPGLVRA